jgi:two-component system, NarL family, nitrate/nitrite response regulator NarL
MASRECYGNLIEETAKPIHALLVDDHALFRESMVQVLSAEPWLQVEHCGSIRDALNRLDESPFDLVLLDHDLGPERASQFLPAARQRGFEGKVLVVTAWVSDNEARRLTRQGASGIFLKQAPVNELLDAIRAVSAGGKWFARPFAENAGEKEGGENSLLFSDRQRRVLHFVLEGLSNKEIAWRLQISESYVKAILQSLFQKTGVRTRGQLVRVAFEQYEDQM